MMGRKRESRPDGVVPEDPERRTFLRRTVAGMGAATVLPGLAEGSAPLPPVELGQDRSPEEFARQIAAELEVYRQVVAAQKLTLE